MGVVEGVIEVRGTVVKGREQEAQLRGADRLVHGAVPEAFFLRHIVQGGFCLLHRADSADEEAVGLVGVVLSKGTILTLKGHIVAVAAHKDQVVSLQNHILDDLLVERSQFFLVFQAAGTKIHEKLMLRTAGNLGGLKAQVNEVFAYAAGKHPAQNGKIFFPLIFRHHAGALAERGNDLFVIVDIAAEDGRHIAPVPAQMPPDLTDFLFVHMKSPYCHWLCPEIITQPGQKIQ